MGPTCPQEIPRFDSAQEKKNHLEHTDKFLNVWTIPAILKKKKKKKRTHEDKDKLKRLVILFCYKHRGLSFRSFEMNKC